MAYTKIHAIKSTLSKAIDYIENPDKTEAELFISGYNVDPLVASVEFEMTTALAKDIKGNYTKTGGGNNLAYHMIQSFSPEDNVTPEQAHEIGKKLADEFLEGKYEYVIATHLDKGHIHNHIIFNAVSFYDLKKINTQPYKTASKIRAISDKICSEHNLSVIPESGKLGHSYTEYQERKANTSWKSEIRKKLNYVLESAVTYEDFIKKANELGITVEDKGKHIKFKADGQERWTRGNKLSDNGSFELNGIKERVKNNQANQVHFKEAIISSAKACKRTDEFATVLKELYSITYKTDKLGHIIFRENENDIKIKQSTLGNAFNIESIHSAIQKGSFEFTEQTENTSIKEEYDNLTKTKIEDIDTPIRVSKENILKITVDGILLELPDQEGKLGKVFIDNNHIDFLENTKEYELHIGDKFDYYFINEKINPDLLESEQLSGKYIKGEHLIRTLELKNGIKPIEMKVAAEYIKTIGQKGITISMPGMEYLFIENEHVILDRASGSCSVNLYPNWNYNFKENADQKILSNIKGKDLFEKLKDQGEQNKSLAWKIAAYDRRTGLTNTKELANVLMLMRKENISADNDFESKASQLQVTITDVKDKIKTIDEKNEQYKTATKYLLAYKKYLPIHQDYLKQNTFSKKKYEQKFESELKAFDHASKQLEKLGVNTNVDTEKVIGLIKNQEHEISNLKKDLEQKTDQLQELRNAQKIVREIQEPQKEREQKTKENEL